MGERGQPVGELQDLLADAALLPAAHVGEGPVQPVAAGMPALKKQRIDLRLTDDDKSIIEEAAAISNQTITQFVVASASERAAEVIEQHRRMVLNEQSWSLVMEAITQPPAPNDRLKRAAKRLQTR